MAFQLTAEEVARGVKLRHGALVVRPSVSALLMGTLAAVFSAGWVVLTVAARSPLLVVAPLAAVQAVNAVLGMRTRVVATPDQIVVTNRTRRRTVAIGQVHDLGLDADRWWFLPPLYTGPWLGSELEFGVLETPDGPVRCEAMTSVPDDRSPARVKVAALNRYVAASR